MCPFVHSSVHSTGFCGSPSVSASGSKSIAENEVAVAGTSRPPRGIQDCVGRVSWRWPELSWLWAQLAPSWLGQVRQHPGCTTVVISTLVWQGLPLPGEGARGCEVRQRQAAFPRGVEAEGQREAGTGWVSRERERQREGCRNAEGEGGESKKFLKRELGQFRAHWLEQEVSGDSLCSKLTGGGSPVSALREMSFLGKRVGARSSRGSALRAGGP